MTKRKLLLGLLFTALFSLNLGAASWLAFTNSDPQPWEGHFPASCASPVVSVVYENDQKPQPKVVEVVLTGDFSRCIGSQVLVTTYKTGNVYSYAVYNVDSPVSEIRLRFDKDHGDLYQKFPLVVNHRLVPEGPLAPPTTSIAAEDITYLFAWSWD